MIINGELEIPKYKVIKRTEYGEKLIFINDNYDICLDYVQKEFSRLINNNCNEEVILYIHNLETDNDDFIKEYPNDMV